ncbi:MAG: hypothetical protein AAB660_01195 [Patescibacteria group bacterium]
MATAKDFKSPLVDEAKKMTEYTLNAKEIFEALSMVPGITIFSRVRQAYDRLVSFVKGHIVAIKSDRKPTFEAVQNTARLARQVEKQLEEVFTKIVNGAPGRFDDIARRIREIDETVLEREFGTIADLQETFRKTAANEEAPFMDIAEAYVEVVNYMQSLLKEVETAAALEHSKMEMSVLNLLTDELMSELELEVAA